MKNKITERGRKLFDANADATVRDWFSLLAHGHTVFAVGSSDSHQVADLPIGYPRTCIEVGVDTAPEPNAKYSVDSTLAKISGVIL